MLHRITIAALLALTAAPSLAQLPALTVNGTRLDVTATGEVVRVPDIVRIRAGVVTEAPTAADALRQNSARMAAVRAALTRAGIADRDIQTNSVRLAPFYRGPGDRQELAGYSVSNQLLIRFRDLSNSGRVIDALVSEGVNEINGPMLDFEHIQSALDEARGRAVAQARARAALYAQALGLRVRRIVYVREQDLDRNEYSQSNSITEYVAPFIDPGGRVLTSTVTVVFELE